MDPRIKSEGDSEGKHWQPVLTLNSLVIAGLDPAIHGTAAQNFDSAHERRTLRE
ncbi:MAG TPA: hypothetical protein VL462_00255 [Candidatus Nitrosotalea sp.]|nr:hypothetical protein [Candidatus Nitrosotalea sp.]